MFELNINGETLYFINGYYYTIDTIPLVNLFDNVEI